MVYGKSASEQAIQSNNESFHTNISTLSADISIVQGEHEAETFESNNHVSKPGVNSCDESVSKANENVFVSGGILFP